MSTKSKSPQWLPSGGAVFIIATGVFGVTIGIESLQRFLGEGATTVTILSAVGSLLILGGVAGILWRERFEFDAGIWGYLCGVGVLLYLGTTAVEYLL